MASKTLAVCALGLALLGGAGCAAPAPMPPPAAVEAATTGATLGALHAEQTPQRLVIPDLDIDRPLAPLGVDPTGEHQVPDDAGTVGWYAGGPTPGEPGPALILGHVDYRGTPGAFAHLDRLGVGDLVGVDRLLYRVTDIRRVPKDEFPRDLVYGRTDRSELRLITCGGVFDHGTGHYRDNVIVSAALDPQQDR